MCGGGPSGLSSSLLWGAGWHGTELGLTARYSCCARMPAVSAAALRRPRLRLGVPLLLVSRVLGVVLLVGCHSADLASRSRPRSRFACPLPALGPTCTEPIPLCSRNVRRASDGVAVVDGSSVYRISYLVQHRGSQWRAGSVAILCNPRFRGTLVREVRPRTLSQGFLSS